MDSSAESPADGSNECASITGTTASLPAAKDPRAHSPDTLRKRQLGRDFKTKRDLALSRVVCAYTDLEKTIVSNTSTTVYPDPAPLRAFVEDNWSPWHRLDAISRSAPSDINTAGRKRVERFMRSVLIAHVMFKYVQDDKSADGLLLAAQQAFGEALTERRMQEAVQDCQVSVSCAWISSFAGISASHSSPALSISAKEAADRAQLDGFLESGDLSSNHLLS